MIASRPCRLHRGWRGCQRLAIGLVAGVYALAARCAPAWARVPIAVQCGDAATRRVTAAVLRRALRDTERLLGHPPAVPLRLRVLAAAGTPPTFADLGHTLAVCQVLTLSGGPRAVVTLATAADDRRLSDDQLVVALTAALDWLDARQSDGPTVWTLPTVPGPAPARLAHDSLRWLPARAPLPAPPATAAPSPADPLGLAGA